MTDAEIVARRFTWDAGEMGAVVLLVGGLFLISTTVLAFLFLRGSLARPGAATRPRPRVLTAFTAAAPRPAPMRAGGEGGLLPVDGARAFGSGYVAGSRIRVPDIDALLDRVVEAGLGEPRILASEAGLKLVRLSGCGCGEVGAGAALGCEFERGFLEGAFRDLVDDEVRVKEVACGGACDFEVTY